MSIISYLHVRQSVIFLQFASMTKGKYSLICQNSCYVSGVFGIKIIRELAVHFTRREIVRILKYLEVNVHLFT